MDITPPTSPPASITTSENDTDSAPEQTLSPSLSVTSLSEVTEDSQGRSPSPSQVPSMRRLGIFFQKYSLCATEESRDLLDNAMPELFLLFFYDKDFNDGPSYPLHIQLEVHGDKFIYSTYSELAAIVDSKVTPLEVWHRRQCRWVELDTVNGHERRLWSGVWTTGQFLIIRRAGHPTNLNCIGLPDLVRTIDFQERGQATTIFAPGTTTEDFAGLLPEPEESDFAPGPGDVFGGAF